jgi:hypothetical protein
LLSVSQQWQLDCLQELKMNRRPALLWISCVALLSACAPITQMVKPPGTTSQASVRFSSSGAGAQTPGLSNFNADGLGVQGSGSAVPASFLAGAGALPLYSTQLTLSLGQRSVSIQVSEKLTPGFSCALGQQTLTGGAVKFCTLSYQDAQQRLDATSGTFSVTGLEGKTLRFAAQATLGGAGGGSTRLDLDGKLDGFSP